ncbi:MAG: GNAT family N-acetyltransferase, partial [Variibacter sp.]|nr:GNAT family N-acetyltransferase [Variibacter sp.]
APSERAAIEAHMRAAFSPNAAILGVAPLPLLADYAETYVAEQNGEVVGALILQPREDDLYIWGIATTPGLQRSGIGGRMLAAAEERAHALPRERLRLRTGEKLTANVAWYQRHGFAIESVEALADRRVVHMVKALA